ncbi:MAG: zinc ribbon domain-containing protein [Candidatus Omnitrophica bacterium]|nr:zinc ribbon domain-containing protein [Candidatus Omnitrophota bacterium]
MPIYEYVCTECKNRFEVSATLAEKEKGLKPDCPRCGSKNTVRFFGGLNFISRSGGGGFNMGSGCGPGCGCS